MILGNVPPLDFKEMTMTETFKPRTTLCERCGGIGKQPAGCWDGSAYNAAAGTCDDCMGAGYLGMTETDADTFFASVGKRNCHPTIVGAYPYTSQFFTDNRQVLGAVVYDEYSESRYFLASED